MPRWTDSTYSAWTGGPLADGDIITLVFDVSDTTQHADGSSYQLTWSILKDELYGYGEIKAESNATATTITTASTDFSNKVQVTIFDTNGSSDTNATPDHTTDDITVNAAGVYRVTVTASISGSASDKISLAAFKNNGATQITARGTMTLDASGNTQSVTCSGLASLAATDTVELWIQNETDTDNVTVEDVSLTVERVGFA